MKKLLFALLLLSSGAAAARGTEPHFTPASAPQIRFVGRATQGGDGSLSFDWSGTYFTFRFEGRGCSMRARDTNRNYYNVFVDGRLHGVVMTGQSDSTILLAEGLGRGEHTVLVQKRTEGEQGRTTLRGIVTDSPLLDAPAAPGRHIEFIGDSHTCGYGTEGQSVKEPFTPQTENCDLAWGCILARYFDADYTLIAHSGQGIVRNWGDEKMASDCTMRERMLCTFDMDPALEWNFGRYRPDIVVIKLGSNDFSTQIVPTEELFNAAYAQTLRQLRTAYGDVPVLCVAPSDNRIILHYLEHFLDQQQDKNLYCAAMLPGITNFDSDMGANFHPNLHGHRKMAMAVAPFISTITGWKMAEKSIE